jgi:hypothetical protein
MHGTAFERLSPKTEKSFKRKTVTPGKTQGHKHFPRTPKNREWNVFAKLRRHQLELQVSTKHSHRRKLATTCNADGVGTYREGSPEPERPTSARGSQGTIERD